MDRIQQTTTSEDETKALANTFAGSLKNGDVVLLEGELGAGKSTFVRGVAQALGYDGPVRSPTFTLMNRYQTSHDSIKEILHLDLYRIEDVQELRTLALEEELGREGTVSFVEWPKEHPALASTSKIQIEITGEFERRITIEN